MSEFKQGDRVRFTRYGSQYAATVVSNPNGGVLILLVDGKATRTWAHAASCTKIEEERT